MKNYTSKKLLCLIPSLGTGGAERQMVELLKMFNEKKIRPTVLTYYSQEQDYTSGLDIDRISITDTNFLIRYFKIIKYTLQAKPDVILSYGGIPNIVAILIALLGKNIKVIVSERNTTQKYTFSKKMLFNWYKLSDVIVPNSKSQTDFIKTNAPFLSDKLKTITNYTDINKFIFKNKGRDYNFKIGIFARYNPQKNTLLFLETVAELNKLYPNVEYHWYGEKFLDENGNPTKHSGYYLLCEEQKNSLQLNNVYLHSFTKNVGEEFEKMDAICLPSLYEGFSNILSEAICCGKPILASAVCDNVYFVKEGENGFLFNPNNKDEIKEAIHKMVLLDDLELIEFQNKSRKLASTLFSKEKFFSDYNSILMK